MRVLLADDHSIVRRGLRGLLEAADISVVAEAADGLEAVRLCEEEHPDLMILDIAMPKLTGIEVAARAQKMDRPPGVIILSVHGDESYIMRALAAGARAYLLKSATDEDRRNGRAEKGLARRHRTDSRNEIFVRGALEEVGAGWRGGPAVAFRANFLSPGLYKAWGQFQHRGNVITADFVLEAKNENW